MDDLIIHNTLKATLGRGLTSESAPRGTEESFGSILKEAIKEVNELQKEADKSIQALATGDNNSIHETIIALEKADISFRLLMQVRNKMIEAYQEVMRMQV